MVNDQCSVKMGTYSGFVTLRRESCCCMNSGIQWFTAEIWIWREIKRDLIVDVKTIYIAQLNKSALAYILFQKCCQCQEKINSTKVSGQESDWQVGMWAGLGDVVHRSILVRHNLNVLVI